MTTNRAGRLSALVALLLPLGVMAQKAPKLEVFGGYSYLQLTEQPSIQLKSAGLSGWSASVKLNVMPRVGLLADFSGYYGRREMTPYTIDLTMSGEPQRVDAHPGDMRQHTFLFGPEIRLL